MWKLRYIEAFNAMEKLALENQEQLVREAAYLEGRQEALSLPVMEAERKKGYLAGLEEGRKLARNKDGLYILTRIRGYLAKGLTHAEIGKILGLSRDSIAKRIERARKNGWLPKPPAQGNLLEVEHGSV